MICALFRRALVRVIAILPLLALAACGFRPLYADFTGGALGTADERLAMTRVLPLDGREGQQLHNLLRDRVNPAGQPGKPSYLLEIKLESRIDELGIRRDETATRANLILEADFVLRPYRSKDVLVRGRAQSVNSYNILDEFYATSVSERNALSRGLREVADSIRLRLAVYFASPRANP